MGDDVLEYQIRFFVQQNCKEAETSQLVGPMLMDVWMVAQGKCQLICRWSAVRFPFKSRENRKGVDFFSESKKKSNNWILQASGCGRVPDFGGSRKEEEEEESVPGICFVVRAYVLLLVVRLRRRSRSDWNVSICRLVFRNFPPR